MKILYLNPDRGIPVLGDKGASVHVREFVTALSQEGHETLLVCATAGEGNEPPPASMIELAPEHDDDDLAQEAATRSICGNPATDRILRRELARLHYDRNFVARVLDVLSSTGFRPDAIYERHALFHSAGATLARTLGIPRLLEVNAPLIQEQERFRGLSCKSAATETEILSFHGANAIIAVSDEVAGYVASTGVRSDMVHTIPNGVDTTRFHPNEDGGEIRRRYDLGDDPVIGFIGSFKPWHGVGFLIDAFATMAQIHPDLRLLCVGEGPELDMAREGVCAHGLEYRTVFTGRVPHAEIPAHLSAMDISVAPYLPSPDFYFSPLKVVESLAAGTPVVASKLGQLEALVDHGETGLLFTPGDSADLIQKTLRLLINPRWRRDMRTRARARAETEFGWNRVVTRVAAEARRLITQQQAA
jgi:glycosyltransferase involved in cell wall biosynthesis